MADGTAVRLTSMLQDIGRGDPDATPRLIALVYDELHHLAQRRMAAEAPQTLQPTALVNEAYLRLFEGQTPAFENRAHFFGAAAEAMRRILVDRARARHSLKRGGGMGRVDLESATLDAAEPAEVLQLDEVLARLEAFDPRGAEVVKLRCFVGMSIAEAAAALNVTTRTINRDWLAARAWLKAELAREACRSDADTSA